MPRLAMIQMRVDGGDAPANRQRALERLDAVARRGAEIALLPEALNLGWTHPSALQEAESLVDGPTVRIFQDAARRYRMWICFGWVERAGHATYNSALLLNADGQAVLHHRKIHELDIAQPLYSRGDRLGVVETPWGRTGVMICADGFAPGLVISRSLGLMGARLVLSPCSWAVPADHDPEREPYGSLWRDSYAPVAREFEMWVAGTSNVGPIKAGPWAGRRCIGCSLLVGPDGNPVLQGSYGEAADTILITDIGRNG